MILSSASYLYGAAASWRRRWYARDPARRRRLARPVISVGNLSVGGSGKTPVVAHIARLLVERGERPAILSRGYARTAPSEGVTVVSDGAAVLAPVERAGDEPLMLARALPEVCVLVGTDRYLCGRMAEERFGATVHVLDDGFQHLALDRDVDLLMATSADLVDEVLPAGRLREPLAAAAAADAVLLSDHSNGGGLERRLGIATSFRVTRTLGPPRWLGSTAAADLRRDEKALAVAGIARPDRFFDDLAAAGWQVVDRLVFRDHHPYSASDVDRIAHAAATASATLVLTTEKDAVRLEGRDLKTLRIAVVPLGIAIDPAGFDEWLISRVQAAPRRG